MRWLVLSILAMMVACQVDTPDGSVVRSGGDSSVQAVDITAENSYARIEITSDAPLVAGEKGRLSIKFTALKNLQTKTMVYEGSVQPKPAITWDPGDAPKVKEPQEPQTYQQKPFMQLNYDDPEPIAVPDLETAEHDDEGKHISSATTRYISVNDMVEGNSFTLNYEITAKSSFFINALLDVGGVEEKFKVGGESGYSNLKIEVGGTYEESIDPKDYATVEITKDTLDGKPTVKIKVTPSGDRELAKKIESIETKFRDTGYSSRSPAVCEGDGDWECGDSTTLTGVFAIGNGITIRHKLAPKQNDATTAGVEVKFILDDKTEIIAGSESLTWSMSEVATIVDSAGAPAAASTQVNYSDALNYDYQANGKIASLQFISQKPQNSPDGLGHLTVVFKTHTPGSWTALEKGAKLHLKLPFTHAYAGIELGSNLVKHVKYYSNNSAKDNATLFSNNETGGRNWKGIKIYEIKFNQITGEKTIKFKFLVAPQSSVQNVRATMKIAEGGGFSAFGGRVPHAVDFTGGCDYHKKFSLTEQFKISSLTSNLGFNWDRNLLLKEDSNSTITINNLNDIILATNGDRDILVDVWGTAGTKSVTWGAGKAKADQEGIKEIDNHHYRRYRIELNGRIVTNNQLNLKIQVNPSRDGRYSVILKNVREGRDSGHKMATFNFNVAPRESCLFDQ